MFIMYALLPRPSNLNLNLSARLAVRLSSSFRLCPFLYPLSLYSLIVYWPIALFTTYTYISGGGIASQKEDSIREFGSVFFC